MGMTAIVGLKNRFYLCNVEMTKALKTKRSLTYCNKGNDRRAWTKKQKQEQHY